MSKKQQVFIDEQDKGLVINITINRGQLFYFQRHLVSFLKLMLPAHSWIPTITCAHGLEREASEGFMQLWLLVVIIGSC